jgi:serpin B
MSSVDFRHGAEAACAAINRWVEEETRGIIREIVFPRTLDADSGLILANAVYFKGLWQRPFPAAATRSEPFYLEGGGQVDARLMHQETRVRYRQADGFQVVDLDYQGDDMSMLVILPDELDGLHALERRVSATMLRDCASTMERRKVKLSLPKFKITWSPAHLKSWLRALGMPLAFERTGADFSGINGYVPPHADALFISDVCQTAFVEVNEEGTEATAASFAHVMGSLSERRPLPSPIFRADHPFLFAIRDRYSDSILFLGRMSDPAKAD